MRRLLTATLPLCAIATSCGGGAPASATAVIVDHVTLVAYLDENRNGILDAPESVRIPNAEITLGPAVGRTSPRTGTVNLDVPRGSYIVSLRESSLPPYYLAPPSRTMATAEATRVDLPITLPPAVGSLSQTTYLAFGDSLTNGDESIGDGTGYREGLANLLRDAFGAARVENEGVPSTDSRTGVRRLSAALTRFRPAFILILYGTNDWDDPACRDVLCTAFNLQSMIQTAKASGVLVLLGTLLPTNVGHDSRASAARNQWIERVNLSLIGLARDEGVVLIDLHKALASSLLTSSQLFTDSLHPSAAGYSLLATTWFEGLTVRR